jgi:hypothetical protein
MNKGETLKRLELLFNDSIRVEIYLSVKGLEKYLFYRNVFRMYRQSQQTERKESQVDMIVYIGKRFSREVLTDRFREGFFCEGNYLRTHYRYKAIIAQVEILDIESIPMVVHIRTNLLGKLIFPTAVINSLVGLNSNRKKVCLVHGSGIGREKKAVLLTGAGSSGKTSLVVRSSREHFCLIADDATFIGKRKIYGFPRPISLEYYHRRMLHFPISWTKQTEFFFKRLLSLLTGGYITLLTDIEVEKFFQNRVEQSAELKATFYLSKGDAFAFREVNDKDRVVDAIVESTQSILQFSVRIGRSYASYVPESYLVNHWSELKKNLRDYINEVPCYEVQTPDVITDDMYRWILQKVKEVLLDIGTMKEEGK